MSTLPIKSLGINLKRLYMYAFLLALLENGTFDRPATREDVCIALTKTKKPCVMFLDEFPLLEGQEGNRVKLRFMRNVFRSLDMVVILRVQHAILPTRQRVREHKEVKLCGAKFFHPFLNFILSLLRI